MTNDILDEGTRERVRARAYEIWLWEGKPAGKQDEHWQRALEDLSVIAEAPPKSVADDPSEGLADATAPGAVSPRSDRGDEAIPTTQAGAKHPGRRRPRS